MACTILLYVLTKKYVGVILYCYNIDIGFTEELTLRNAPAAMQQAGQAGVSLDIMHVSIFCNIEG